MKVLNNNVNQNYKKSQNCFSPLAKLDQDFKNKG